MGGTNRDGYCRTVEYAEVGPQGDLGYWGKPEQAAAATQRRHTQIKQAQAAHLPNEGEVREILHTETYSYIRAATPVGEQWLATERSDYRVDRSGCADGELPQPRARARLRFYTVLRAD